MENENLKKKPKKRLETLSDLIQKHPDKADYFNLYYGEKTILFTEKGPIDFDPASINNIVGAEKMTYAEYLDVQINSLGKTRSYFQMCFYNCAMEFTGQIEKVNSEKICFKCILVSGMFPDGEMFDGKEDHVWMDIAGFDSFLIKEGYCFSFYAEVYPYIKTGNGKRIDYALRNPKGIKKIGNYKLPSDSDLIKQAFERMTCETCFLNEHCNKTYCILNKKNNS